VRLRVRIASYPARTNALCLVAFAHTQPASPRLPPSLSASSRKTTKKKKPSKKKKTTKKKAVRSRDLSPSRLPFFAKESPTEWWLTSLSLRPSHARALSLSLSSTQSKKKPAKKKAAKKKPKKKTAAKKKKKSKK